MNLERKRLIGLAHITKFNHQQFFFLNDKYKNYERASDSRNCILSLHIGSYFDKLPDPGQDKNTVDFTCKNPKGNGDNDE